MLNCKDMTKLISDALDGNATLPQRMELWMHITLCGMCRRFRSNALAIRRKVRETGSELIEVPGAGAERADASLSRDARKRITAAMKKFTTPGR